MSNFVTFTEIVDAKRREKNRHYKPDKYHGYVLKKQKGFITAVCQGPGQKDPLTTKDFYNSEYVVNQCDKEEVLHYFKAALLDREKEVLDAEFELEHQRLELKKDKKLIALAK